MPGHGSIRAVIFDMGGVILRTDDPRERDALARRFGVTRSELEAVIFNNPVAIQSECGLVSNAEAWEESARRLHFAPAEIPAVRQAFFAGDQVDFELVELIRSLRGGYITALLSNSWEQDLPRFLSEKLRIAPEVFDFIISSAQCGMMKPDEKIFRHALEQIGVQPQEAVFVDDFDRNIRAAAALGIHAVPFRSTPQVKADLLSLLGEG